MLAPSDLPPPILILRPAGLVVRLRGGIGPLKPAPAHPYFRVPRGWLSAYAGGFIKSGLPEIEV